MFDDDHAHARSIVDNRTVVDPKICEQQFAQRSGRVCCSGCCTSSCCNPCRSAFRSTYGLVERYCACGCPPQDCWFNALPSSPVYGGSYAMSGACSCGGTPSYIAGGACYNSGNILYYPASSATASGACTVTISKSACASYEYGESSTTLTIGKIGQSISFTDGITWAYYLDSFTVSASTSSGLGVTFFASGGCSVSGSTVSINSGSGYCYISASQGGSNVYHAASASHATITLYERFQSISYTPISISFYDQSQAFSATSSSGGAVSISTNGNCVVSGGSLRLTAGGTCIITLTQGGQPGFWRSVSSSPSTPVNKIGQTITLSASPGTLSFTNSYTPSASTTSNLALAWSTTGVCTINAARLVTFSSVGSCNVFVDQGGDGNHNPAAQVSHSVNVVQASQTINVSTTLPASPVVGGTTHTASATATSGLAVGYSASGGCSNVGSTISFVSATTCTVTFSQTGNTNYAAATSVVRTTVVGKGSQSITFTSTVPTAATVFQTYTVTATATVSPVTFTSATPAVCATSGTNGATVNFASSGTCIIKGDQVGNSNYNAAPQAQLPQFSVAPASQTITLSGAPGSPVFGGSYTPTATSTSSLTVDITVSPIGVCTKAGAVVNFVGVGSCTTTARQTGDARYAAAAPQTHSFTVAKAPQTITMTSTAPGSGVVGGATYTATGTASSGLAITFSGTASICTVTGNVFSFIGAGTCTVSFNQAGGTSVVANLSKLIVLL